MNGKRCPDCGQSVAYLAECPECGADLRTRCEDCDLPLSGKGELCHCGAFSKQEREEFYRTAPPKSANRGNGGRGHNWLRNRRARRAA